MWCYRMIVGNAYFPVWSTLVNLPIRLKLTQAFISFAPATCSWRAFELQTMSLAQNPETWSQKLSTFEDQLCGGRWKCALYGRHWRNVRVFQGDGQKQLGLWTGDPSATAQGSRCLRCHRRMQKLNQVQKELPRLFQIRGMGSTGRCCKMSRRLRQRLRVGRSCWKMSFTRVAKPSQQRLPRAIKQQKSTWLAHRMNPRTQTWIRTASRLVPDYWFAQSKASERGHGHFSHAWVWTYHRIESGLDKQFDL